MALPSKEFGLVKKNENFSVPIPVKPSVIFEDVVQYIASLLLEKVFHGNRSVRRDLSIHHCIDYVTSRFACCVTFGFGNFLFELLHKRTVKRLRPICCRLASHRFTGEFTRCLCLLKSINSRRWLRLRDRALGKQKGQRSAHTVAGWHYSARIHSIQPRI